jgi:prepilin-type N-terminal cleavage/methylation domain-containing protein
VETWWTNRPLRRAFTLVELLVVVAIIGILVALLLSAIQAAREVARRAQCSINLKQVGIGTLNFENSTKVLPPFRVTDADQTHETRFASSLAISF